MDATSTIGDADKSGPSSKLDALHFALAGTKQQALMTTPKGVGVGASGIASYCAAGSTSGGAT